MVRPGVEATEVVAVDSDDVAGIVGGCCDMMVRPLLLLSLLMGAAMYRLRPLLWCSCCSRNQSFVVDRNCCWCGCCRQNVQVVGLVESKCGQ